MIQIRKSDDRGISQMDWLNSLHTFSFAQYRDPKFMRFGDLRVINEDIVQPGMGFGRHPHRDMEIVSYVVEGQLEHKDSMGNGSIIKAGEIQIMTAGAGVEHSEFNHSNTDLLHFLQIWTIPEQLGLAPRYQQISIRPSQNKLVLIGSRDGSDTAVTIHQIFACMHAFCKIITLLTIPCNKSEFQFKEKRMPTLEEINAVATDTPVFILHLYDRALLNRAALRAIGYDKNTKALPGTAIERDKEGNPTGMLIATPNAIILYSALAQRPKLNKQDQMNSTLHFMCELNRLGVTRIVDAGGGFQNYPDDYEIVNQLNQENKLTVRIAYNLFNQKPGGELQDFAHWTKTSHYQQGNDYYRHNGAGEMLVFSAADFEDFLQPRPDLPIEMERQLEPVVRLLAQNQWPFRLHATYDESITRALTIYEKVHQEAPIDQLHWFFDHAETISKRSIERVKHLGGGIAIQNRMAFQGEYFMARYGKEKTLLTPPIQALLEAEIPVGMGR